MSYDVCLEDVNGEQILPITRANNVFVSDAETLDEVLKRIAQSGAGGAYVLPVASTTTLGGIKVGKGLEITEDGTLNCTVAGGVSYTQTGINGRIVPYTLL